MNGPGDPLVSASAILIAALAWSALAAAVALRAGARRHEPWPSYWFAALLLAVAPSLVGLGLSLVPSPVPHFEFDVAAGASQFAAGAVGGAPSPAGPPAWLTAGAAILLSVYGIGVGSRLARLVAQGWRTRRLVRAARPLTSGRARPNGGAAILVTEAAVSPFCAGGPGGPAIVVSRPVLDALTPLQLDMVIAHEAQHLRRRDPLLFAVLALVEALFWPSRPVRALVGKTRTAAEIQCDAAAAGASEPRRRIYAEALVHALEVMIRNGAPAVGFGGGAESSRVRLSHILSRAPVRRDRLISLAVIGLAAVAALSGAALAASAGRVAALANPSFARAVEGRVSKPYGGAGPDFHAGVDVAAPPGSPVRAPARGYVVHAGDDFQGEAHWGRVVLLRHPGGWMSLYAHLDDVSTRAGDYVEAGQRIGGVGSTGVSTGPHVHVEVTRHGQRVDPRAIGATP